MKLLALIAVSIYCGVSLFMAVRLMLLSRRTRELPELLIGLAFLCGGMLGYPFSVASGVLLGASRPGAANIAYLVGQAGVALAAYFVLLSWRHIFGPNTRGGRAMMAAWTTLLIVALVGLSMTTKPVVVQAGLNGFYWFSLVIQGSCYATMAWSSYSQASMLHRRSAIGLADPVVANRLLLWGISNTSIVCSYVYPMLSDAMTRMGRPSIYEPAVIAFFGLFSACCMTLVFLPPRSYVRRIRANSTLGEA